MVLLDHTTIRDASAGSNGGAIVAGSSTIIVQDSLIRDTYAAALGGILLAYATSVTFIRSLLQDSEAAYGGACLAHSSSSIVLRQSVISDCFATFEGAAVYMESSRLSLQQSSLHNTIAGNSGAAVYVTIPADSDYYLPEATIVHVTGVCRTLSLVGYPGTASLPWRAVVIFPPLGCTVTDVLGTALLHTPACADGWYTVAGNRENLCGRGASCTDHSLASGLNLTTALCTCTDAYPNPLAADLEVAPYRASDGCLRRVLADSLTYTAESVAVALHKSETAAGAQSVELLLRLNGTDWAGMGTSQWEWYVEPASLPFWVQPLQYSGLVLVEQDLVRVPIRITQNSCLSLLNPTQPSWKYTRASLLSKRYPYPSNPASALFPWLASVHRHKSSSTPPSTSRSCSRLHPETLMGCRWTTYPPVSLLSHVEMLLTRLVPPASHTPEAVITVYSLNRGSPDHTWSNSHCSRAMVHWCPCPSKPPWRCHAHPIRAQLVTRAIAAANQERFEARFRMTTCACSARPTIGRNP